jgi:hypothetical protein
MHVKAKLRHTVNAPGLPQLASVQLVCCLIICLWLELGIIFRGGPLTFILI